LKKKIWTDQERRPYGQGGRILFLSGVVWGQSALKNLERQKDLLSERKIIPYKRAYR
jgi:hypothetical protein